MMSKILSLSICLGALLAAQGLSANAQAASAGEKPQKLEHMDYIAARKIILGYGWAPMSGHCEQVSEKTCSSFPEIASCSGVGAGYCGMVFFRQDRCLYVTTSGGEPEGDGVEDTHVEKVTFRHGPCSKN